MQRKWKIERRIAGVTNRLNESQRIVRKKWKIIERILPVESSVLGDEQFKLEMNRTLFLSFFWCCYSMRFFVRIRRINVQRKPNAKWAVLISLWMCLILLIDRKVKATITSHRASRSNASNNIYVQIFDGGKSMAIILRPTSLRLGADHFLCMCVHFAVMCILYTRTKSRVNQTGCWFCGDTETAR